MDSLFSISELDIIWNLKSLLVFIVVFLITADYIKNLRPAGYPPGPPAFPIVGNIFTVNPKREHEDLTELSKKYGDVFSLRYGQIWVVVVNGSKALREALVTKGDSVVDRPPLPLIDDTFKGRGKPFDPHLLINNTVSNIICHLVFGHRFEYGDEKFNEMMMHFEVAFEIQTSIWGKLYNAFPRLMRCLPGPHSDMKEMYRKIADFVKVELDEHKKHWDPSDIKDYIDFYLNKMQMDQEEEVPDSTFDEENLVSDVMDLFSAGSETTSTTLRWAFLYMAKYPEIQDKVRAEIHNVIGKSTEPCIEDRPNLPYTDAVIHELLRISNIVPLSVPHVTGSDVQLGGFDVPKGVLILPNLTSVLFDGDEWETPHTFNPAHFLNEDGEFVKKAAFVPFSAGKRVCPGESLAKMELFLFFTSFLQHFSFSMPTGMEPVFDYRSGITLTPKPYEICITPC